MEGTEAVPDASSSLQQQEVHEEKVLNVRSSVLKERAVIMSEANKMADYALQSIHAKKGNRFQYQRYINVIQERQLQAAKINEVILKPENFESDELYMKMRAKYSNEALNLDIKKIEIECTVANISSDDQQSVRSAEPEVSDRQVRRLEILKLEKFTGSVESWLSFWSRFEQRVHKNERLTKMEKYDYLRQYSAPNVINRLKTIPLSEEFYDTAVNRLKLEFGSEEKVMSHFTEKLLQVKDVQSRFDIEGLRSLVQLVQSSLAALKTAGLTLEYVSPFFLPILKKVTPVELYLEFQASQRAACTDNRSMCSSGSRTAEASAEVLQALIEFLSDVCEDMSEVDPDKLRKLNEREGQLDKRSVRTATVSALPMTSKSETKVVRKPDEACLFCRDRKHRTEACGSKMTLDEKKKQLANERRCFRCTRMGHAAKDCRASVSCARCKRKNHISSLCREPERQREVNCCASDQSNTARSFMTVEAFAYGPNGKRRSVRVLLDGGAELSFVKTGCAEALGINLSSKSKTQIPIRMFNKTTTIVETSRVEFRLQRKDAPAEKMWISCQAVEEMVEGEFKPQLDEETTKQLEDLKIRLADDPRTEKPIEIVIGLDHLVEFQTHNAIKLTNTLEVVETRLGWTLFGRRTAQESEETRGFQQSTTACLITSADAAIVQSKTQDEVDRALDKQFREFIEAEALQFEADEEMTKDEFVEDFMKNVEFDQKSKRFIVRLPFRKGIVPSVNRNLCLARLKSLEARLRKSGMRERYQAELESMMELGFIERATEDESPEGTVSYIPHREVVREDSLTTKVRIVFDASAKERGGCSLNEALWSGPNLNADLLGVLLNFRRYAVTLMADIEKSFPQIVVHRQDRDALRLLWDYDGTGRPQEFRLTRNYFGLAPSPFILAACVRSLIDSYQGPHCGIVRQVAKGCYVDDLVISVPEVPQAAQIYEVARAVFAGGSFSLRKWFSNSEELRRKFREDDVSVEKFIGEGAKDLRVLGLRYDGSIDTLRIERPKAEKSPSSLTKRKVLSIVSSVYDRLGILAPVILKAKLIMQEIYRIPKMRWDDPVPESIKATVTQWSDDIEHLSELQIPRKFTNCETKEEKVEIHLFSDASSVACGVAVYIVTTNAQQTRTSGLVMARTRVAPLKKATIPRLELTALAMAAETCAYLRRQLRFEIQAYHLWTDSTSVFYQVRSQQVEKLPLFVRNRVTKIRELIGDAKVRHLPGHLNPSDIASRGCRVRELESSTWFVGPKFIREETSSWPTQPEMPKLVGAMVKTPLVKATLEFDRVGKRWKLRRSVAYVLRFKDYIREVVSRDMLKDRLTTAELIRAEIVIVQEVQKEVFGREIKCLIENRSLPENSKMRCLNPFLKDGVLCLGGRLDSHQGDVPKNPPILPAGHKVSKLFLAAVHERSLHVGVNQSLVESRKRYWIPRARQLLLHIIRGCPNCRRFHAKAGATSIGTPPESRVSRSAPFAHVGTDVAGPLFVRQGELSKKIWLCIFTCSAVRAVHLELLNSLSAKDFLMALRRFKARRGWPRSFYSDNAGAYRRAAEDLREISALFQDSSLVETLNEEGVEWNFNVEKAAWMNGFVERLVGILKTALKKVVARQTLKYEELETVVCEIEESMNRRPLCQVSDSENIDVLKPLHFLIAEDQDRLQDSCLPPKVKRSEILARWRHRKKIVEDVWKRWEGEYLSLLRNFHMREPSESSVLKVGQVVIIHDASTPKLFWKLGRITKLNTGRDGVVRSCMLRLGNGRIIQRPIKLLYQLEIIEDE